MNAWASEQWVCGQTDYTESGSPTKEIKWNESGFRPPLCTYRLNWARRTSWGWDDWDDTVLQTQDSKFEPWRSEAEHATSRSRRLPTILTFTRGRGRNNFVSFKPPRPGTEPRTLAWKAAVLTTTLGPPPPTKDNEMNLIVLSSRPTTGSLKASTLFLVHRGSPRYWILKFVKGGNIFKPPYQSGGRAHHIHHYTRPTVACIYVLFFGGGGHKITFCINVFYLM